MISPNDLDLVQVYDRPQEVVDAIFAFYEKRGFAPSPAGARGAAEPLVAWRDRCWRCFS